MAFAKLHGFHDAEEAAPYLHGTHSTDQGGFPNLVHLLLVYLVLLESHRRRCPAVLNHLHADWFFLATILHQGLNGLGPPEELGFQFAVQWGREGLRHAPLCGVRGGRRLALFGPELFAARLTLDVVMVLPSVPVPGDLFQLPRLQLDEEVLSRSSEGFLPLGPPPQELDLSCSCKVSFTNRGSFLIASTCSSVSLKTIALRLSREPPRLVACWMSPCCC